MPDNKPIYLLADSTPLFDKDSDGHYFLSRIRKDIEKPSPKAAYIGASNGDEPQFYDLFTEAMRNIEVEDCSMIKSSFNNEDKKNLEEADIILLAGGDVKSGWDIISSTGMKDIIAQRFNDGATLIGVSAGSRHLSWQSLGQDNDEIEYLLDTLKLVPFFVTTGGSQKELKTIIDLSEGMKKGFVIPPGGMLVYFSDQTVSAVRRAADELVWVDGNFKHSIVLPEDAHAEGSSS